jgi:NAD(P)-dependent dehydrogenase (short-subunit alcohol dehydrogenase family)
MGLLDGKVAVVTGAGNGIGRAVALGLAAAGADVVVNDYGVSVDGRDPSSEPARAVVKEIEARGGRVVASPHRHGGDAVEFSGQANDNFSKMRKQYVEMGGERSNTRYGWIRTKV